MNYLQLFGNPNTYILSPTLEGYNDEIKFNFSSIEIQIKDCNQDQIKMFDKNKIQRCEEPKCNKSCPVDISAICVPYFNELINDITKNKCTCLPGWEGENCDNKILINYKYVFLLL